MAGKISDFTALTGANLASGDKFEVLDVSDTSLASTGTNKSITGTELRTAVAGQALTTHTNWVSGQIYPVSGFGRYQADWSTTGSVALQANYLHFIPFNMGAPFTADALQFYVGGAAVSFNIRFGLFEPDDTAGMPGTLTYDLGAVAVSTTGTKTLTFGANKSVSAGEHWLGYVFDQALDGSTFINTVSSAGVVQMHALAGVTTAGVLVRKSFTYGSLTSVTGATFDTGYAQLAIALRAA